MYNTIQVHPGVVVNIPVTTTPIGVNLSGGVDSALLLFLLMKFAPQHIFAYTYVPNLRGRINAITTVNVIEQCIQLTGNINVTHLVSYHEELNDAVFSSPKKYIDQGVITDLYTGITANPPLDATQLFDSPTTEQLSRDPAIIRPTFYEEHRWHTPFTNMDKRGVFDVYRRYNLLQSLFPFTRSCESLRPVSTQHCGVCWWCKERIWGFGTLS